MVDKWMSGHIRKKNQQPYTRISLVTFGGGTNIRQLAGALEANITKFADWQLRKDLETTYQVFKFGLYVKE